MGIGVIPFIVLCALILALVVATAIRGLLALTGRGKGAREQLTGEEEQAFRELWGRLDRLENRLGNLETILTAEAPRATQSTDSRKA